MRPLGRRLVGFGFGLCFGFGQNRSRSRRGGKVGISRLRRDFQGSVGAGENLLLVFAGFQAPAFSTALFGRRADQLFSRAAVTPHYVRAVTDRDALAKSRSSAPSARAPAANRPQSFVSPTPSSPAQPASGGAYPPSRPPSPLQRNGCHGRCTTRRTAPRFRSPRATRPSPCGWILPPPVGRNRSRWWRRPESRSGHTSDHHSATDACCRRCAAASPATAVAVASAGAGPACAVWSPARRRSDDPRHAAR